jgi:lysophospholipase L1-like esterase
MRREKPVRSKKRSVTFYLFVIAVVLIISAFSLAMREARIPGQGKGFSEWQFISPEDPGWSPVPETGKVVKEGLLLPYGENVLLLKGKDQALTQYSVRLEIATRVSGWTPLFDFDFCSGYRWRGLAFDAAPMGVFKDGAVLVSRADYSPVLKKWDPHKSTPYVFDLICDLEQETVDIIIDGIRYETVRLDGAKLKSSFLVKLRTDCWIRSIRISDSAGKNIFEADYTGTVLPAFFSNAVKPVSWVLFIVGSLLMLFQSAKISRVAVMGACLVCLVGGEALLRINEKNNPAFNIDKVLETPSWDIGVMTNLFGVHNESPRVCVWGGCYPKVKPSDVYRIVCVGSSSTEGHGIADKQNVYPWQIEKKLKKIGAKRSEVINAGKGGYETFRLGIFIEDVLLRLDPDLIIIYLGVNDVRMQNDYLLFSAQYQRMQRIMEKHSSWITNARLLFMALELRFVSKPAVLFYDLLNSSYLFQGLKHVRDAVAHSFSPGRAVDRLTLSEKEQLWADALSNIVRACRARHVKLLLVPELWYPDYDLIEPYRNIMEKISQENPNVDYLDIRKAFPHEQDTALFLDQVHPNELGHARLADECAKKIISMERSLALK